MTFVRSRLHQSRSDRGVALMTVMLTLLVLTALGATAATISINNLKNANRDRQAGSALGAADAGVAQAIEYIRNNGVADLTCSEAAVSSCTGQVAGFPSPTSPKTIALDAAGTGCAATATNHNCATVYITYVTKFAPPTVKTGVYAIHSTGSYGPGPGKRNIVQTVNVSPDKYPVGVFTQSVTGNGSPTVTTESVFSNGCINPLYNGSGNSNGTKFVGTVDPYWNQPPAAHSTVGASTTNNTTCGSSDSGLLPSSSSCSNSALMYDQAPTGGVLSSTSACYRKYNRGDGTYYPDGTCPSGVAPTQPSGLCDTNSFTQDDLNRYGYIPRGLTSDQYAALKTRAKAQSLYDLSSGYSAALTAAVNSGIKNPVLYFDCQVMSCSSVSLKASDFPAALETSATTTCSSTLKILTIVVEHGSLNLSGGNSTTLDAAIFVPDGTYDNDGSINLYGTLFAQNTNITGGPSFQLDSCWTTAFPGAILSVKTKSFREDDSTG